MKTDIHGCSTCPAGEERYEFFYSRVLQANRVQYDYRTVDGELYSCVAPSLEIARSRRDEWLKSRKGGQ